MTGPNIRRIRYSNCTWNQTKVTNTRCLRYNYCNLNQARFKTQVYGTVTVLGTRPVTNTRCLRYNYCNLNQARSKTQVYGTVTVLGTRLQLQIPGVYDTIIVIRTRPGSKLRCTVQ